MFINYVPGFQGIIKKLTDLVEINGYSDLLILLDFSSTLSFLFYLSFKLLYLSDSNNLFLLSYIMLVEFLIPTFHVPSFYFFFSDWILRNVTKIMKRYLIIPLSFQSNQFLRIKLTFFISLDRLYNCDTIKRQK